MSRSHVVAVDVGGTFTDVVSVSDGAIVTAKVPTDIAASDRSVLAGAAEVGVDRASIFNLASTAGLNAVITRRLPKVGFLTTYGHRDILDRGTIIRPREALTDCRWRRGFGDARGEPLVPRYLRRGIRERLTADGAVLIPLDEAQAREELRVLGRCGVAGVAICLLHAYVEGAHERRLRELVREELGDVPISISSEVSPLAREYARASTTLIDLFMKILYGAYTARLEQGLEALRFTGDFNYADCRANLLPADYAMERPYQLVFGGPAGGTISSAHFGRMIGDGNLLCADVGGTSVDISLVLDGEPWGASSFELEHDLVVNSAAINIVTLGAGGGSIVAVTPEGDIETGPDSAGAQPGPACYGAGGSRPTVTDTALLMGILDPDGFLGGRKKLYPELALKAYEGLETSLPLEERIRFGWGMAINNIAEGLRNISIGRGIDPREFSLMCFGAAGPMLLPAVLEKFPMRRAIVPPHPGLFSALGLVSSDRVYSDQRGRYLTLGSEAASAIDEIYSDLERRLKQRLGDDYGRARIVRSFDGHLKGQSWDTPFVDLPQGPIDAAAIAAMIERFHQLYARLNGNRFDHLPVEAVTYRVQAVVPAAKVRYPEAAARRAPLSSRAVMLRYLYDEAVVAQEYRREELGCGDRIAGPAIVREPMSTSLVPRGCRLMVGTLGELIIEQERDQ
jgi:N-methylhydantoinase A